MSQCPHDPFKKAREEDGVLECEFQGENVPMILRHADVKAAAKDWETYSSDAPFRVPIPSEEDVRSVRQLPIEVDPPEHSEYRKLVLPFFRRPAKPEMIEKMQGLIQELIGEALRNEATEMVYDFALPLQSRALTYLLNVPESEADEWIRWGVHVFRDEEAEGGGGDVLADYIDRAIERTENSPGEDLFSAMHAMEYQGRKLTKDEMRGFANLAFAGGRDTIINTVCLVVAHIAKHPEVLAQLRETPKLINTAIEEFVRFLSPLTHIGRVCPVDTDVHGVSVKPKGRVSLGWAAANYDETVFEAPEELRLDRKPNPHVAYGSGAHLCLGAAHARLVIRTLLGKLSELVERIDVLEAVEHVEGENAYQRTVGYTKLVARMVGQ